MLMKTKAMTNAGWTPKIHQKKTTKIHQKYIKSKTKRRKLSAIYFKAAYVVPDGFFSAVPDGIGAKRSKFGDVPADLFFFKLTLEPEDGTDTSDIILGN